MTFHYRYRKQIFIITVIVIVITAITGFGIYKYQTRPKKTIDTVNIKKESTKKNSLLEKEQAEKMKEPEEYMVDIKGEVVTPGIYKLKKSSRVIDVIEKAGGLTPNADTTVINLSKKITDEMVIIIYSKQEVKNWIKTKEQEAYLQEKCKASEEGKVENDACLLDKKEETSTQTKVNINTATKEELMTLSGIGESKAEEIMTYRKSTPFKTIEDLKNVSGIGDATYEQIKNYITV